jgi:hypothetical protein
MIKKNGSLGVRTSRCGKGEKRVAMKDLIQQAVTSSTFTGQAGPQGPQGPQGSQGVPGLKGEPGQLNLSACRVTPLSYVLNFINSGNSILYAEVFCDPNNELLLEDEAKVSIFSNSTGTKAALQGRLTYTQNVGGDTRDCGIGIYANRFATVGQGAFDLSLRGLCCPR